MSLLAKSSKVVGSDSQQFEAMFDTHHEAVLAYALRRTASPDDAADALAETFVVAWRKLDDAPAGDAARWWLFAIARHSIGNALRSERRREALASAVASELSIAIAESNAGIESVSEDIDSALSALREDEREVLLLNAWEDLRPREIAEVLGIGRATARTRLHRARKTFVAAMEMQKAAGAIGVTTAVPSEEMT